ncbi:hypothetical protein C8J56DRAFT_1046414 [Mycena floridula]|nr:hypothetical protein C8J56DRAFT_1046414 [Mycena floridula]
MAPDAVSIWLEGALSGDLSFRWGTCCNMSYPAPAFARNGATDRHGNSHFWCNRAARSIVVLAVLRWSTALLLARNLTGLFIESNATLSLSSASRIAVNSERVDVMRRLDIAYLRWIIKLDAMPRFDELSDPDHVLKMDYSDLQLESTIASVPDFLSPTLPFEEEIIESGAKTGPFIYALVPNGRFYSFPIVLSKDYVENL